jgi:hypothetical protein
MAVHYSKSAALPFLMAIKNRLKQGGSSIDLTAVYRRIKGGNDII